MTKRPLPDDPCLSTTYDSWGRRRDLPGCGPSNTIERGAGVGLPFDASDRSALDRDERALSMIATGFTIMAIVVVVLVAATIAAALS